MPELELAGSSADVEKIVLVGGYSSVEVLSSGGGYGLLEVEEPGNSEESVASDVLDEGESTVDDDPGTSVVEYVSVVVD